MIELAEIIATFLFVSAGIFYCVKIFFPHNIKNHDQVLAVTGADEPVRLRVENMGIAHFNNAPNRLLANNINDYPIQVEERHVPVDAHYQDAPVEVASQHECPVCFGNVNPDASAFLTRCGHWYHDASCFQPWYVKQQNCPKCRTGITDIKSNEALGYLNSEIDKPAEEVNARELLDLIKYSVISSAGDSEYYLRIIGYLKDNKGWNINGIFEDGKTMLILAVIHNNLEAVKALLTYGADKNIVDNDSYYAFIYAFNSNNEEITRLLADN